MIINLRTFFSFNTFSIWSLSQITSLTNVGQTTVFSTRTMRRKRLNFLKIKNLIRKLNNKNWIQTLSATLKYRLFRGLNHRFWIGWAYTSMLCKFVRIFIKINFTKYSNFFRSLELFEIWPPKQIRQCNPRPTIWK